MQYLFLGGPKNGQLIDVEDGTESVNVPGNMMDEEGVPILQTIRYVKRGLTIRQNSTGQTFVRHLYVPDGMPPQIAEVMLGELFVMMWVLEGDPAPEERPPLQLAEPIELPCPADSGGECDGRGSMARHVSNGVADGRHNHPRLNPMPLPEESV